MLDPAKALELKDYKKTIKTQQIAEKNIRYYKKMFDKGVLTRDKYDILVDFWGKIVSRMCPVCGKDALEWHIVVDCENSEPCFYQ